MITLFTGSPSFNFNYKMAEFYKELLETYVYASSKYANEFKTIKSNRSVEGLASL